MSTTGNGLHEADSPARVKPGEEKATFHGKATKQANALGKSVRGVAKA